MATPQNTTPASFDPAAISSAVKKELDAVGLPQLIEQLAELKASGVNRKALSDIQDASNGTVDRSPNQGGEKEMRGRNVAKFVMAVAGSKVDRRFNGDPAAYAAKHFGAEHAVTKALLSSTEAAGGALVPDTLSSDFVGLLYPQSTVMALGPRVVPLDGKLNIPKMTTGATGTWLGEGSNATASQQTFGLVGLDPKKFACVTPVSNDLIRRAGPQAEAFVRDDLVNGAAAARDLAFIRGDGTAAAPRGLKSWAPTASPDHVFAANATVNLGNVTADLGTAIQLLMTANVPMIRPGWIISPRTWRYLYTVRDGNGNFAFKEEMSRGQLMGIPFRWTSQIPETLGSPATATEVYLADFNDIVVGEATKIMIEASTEAAFYDGSAVQSAWSQDLTTVRLIMETDLVARRQASIVLIDTVRWT